MQQYEEKRVMVGVRHADSLAGNKVVAFRTYAGRDQVKWKKNICCEVRSEIFNNGVVLDVIERPEDIAVEVDDIIFVYKGVRNTPGVNAGFDKKRR